MVFAQRLVHATKKYIHLCLGKGFLFWLYDRKIKGEDSCSELSTTSTVRFVTVAGSSKVSTKVLSCVFACRWRANVFGIWFFNFEDRPVTARGSRVKEGIEGSVWKALRTDDARMPSLCCSDHIATQGQAKDSTARRC
jgi:hypothetical protein